MKEPVKKWCRPALIFLGGALVGLGYYYLAGCSTGTCAITSSPFRSMMYMGLMSLLLSGVLGSSCQGSCNR